ncbi:MAG: thermonuclease family protein [Arcobacteraceae bacterium]|jgi:micrococcal nuclease
MKIIFLIVTLVTLSFSREYIGTIVKVTDGDTIQVQSNSEILSIRVLYIDTPEKFGGSKLEKDSKQTGINSKKLQELGKLSSNYASKFFKKDDVVKVVSYKKDRYGRLLGEIYKNNINYSYKIVSDGYACIYKQEKYPMELSALLIDAKSKRNGLWGVNYQAMEALCY